MCTVTGLPRSVLASDATLDPLWLRVVCNRDERTTRAAAVPPTLWTAGARRVLMPIDPDSGGTWMAANDAGLVFVLLNANGRRTARASNVSRGTIIPRLMASATTSQALSLAQEIPCDRFAPFRLLILDCEHLVDCWPDGDRIRHHHRSSRAPWLRSSSSLGDDLVARPRRALFRRLLREESDPRRAQDLFHHHRWPGREAISVDMQRHDARTVSRTVVEIREHSVRLAYHAVEWSRPVEVQVAA